MGIEGGGGRGRDDTGLTEKIQTKVMHVPCSTILTLIDLSN